MPDKLRERITFWVSVLSLLTGLFIVGSAVSGKIGIFLIGPNEIIAEAKRSDSLRVAHIDSLITTRRIETDIIHAHLDSVNERQDREQAIFGRKIDMLIALGCSNYARRDREISQLQEACSSNLNRWRQTP